MNAEDIPSVSAVFISCKNVTRQKKLTQYIQQKAEPKSAAPMSSRRKHLSHKCSTDTVM